MLFKIILDDSYSMSHTAHHVSSPKILNSVGMFIKKRNKLPLHKSFHLLVPVIKKTTKKIKLLIEYILIEYMELNIVFQPQTVYCKPTECAGACLYLSD